MYGFEQGLGTGNVNDEEDDICEKDVQIHNSRKGRDFGVDVEKSIVGSDGFRW